MRSCLPDSFYEPDSAESDAEVPPMVNMFKASDAMTTSKTPTKNRASPSITGTDMTMPTTPVNDQVQGFNTPSTDGVPSLTGSTDLDTPGGADAPTTPATASIPVRVDCHIARYQEPQPTFITTPVAGRVHRAPAPVSPRSSKRVTRRMDRPRRLGQNDQKQFRAKVNRYIPRSGSIHDQRVEHERRLLLKAFEQCADGMLVKKMGELGLHPCVHGMPVDTALALATGHLERLSL